SSQRTLLAMTNTTVLMQDRTVTCAICIVIACGVDFILFLPVFATFTRKVIEKKAVHASPSVICSQPLIV
ncbi:MAG: hypothetical protein J7555_10955, partial [Chloroflexi bacterium]|nr:hypothetical protein [Chloroflexota bacterium]